MEITFAYKQDGALCAGTELYANDVFVGELCLCGKDTLLWNTGMDALGIKFAIKNGEIFDRIVAEIKDYKNKNGIQRICINASNSEIGTFFSCQFLYAHGFYNDEDGSPSLFYCD